MTTASGLLLRPGSWSSQEVASIGKEGVSQLNPEGLEDPIYMRVEEYGTGRFPGVCPSLPLYC